MESVKTNVLGYLGERTDTVKVYKKTQWWVSYDSLCHTGRKVKISFIEEPRKKEGKEWTQ